MHIRPVQSSDAHVCGRIIYDAFVSIADKHNFPRDFPSLERAVELARAFSSNPAFLGVVAEVEERIVGSNFLDKRDSIGAIGPITVDPTYHGRGAGRALMNAVIEHGKSQPKLRGLRLVQDAFNTVSMSLYASLGFDAKEPLAVVQGQPTDRPAGNGETRPMTERDLDRCASLCEQVHGLTRTNELRDAIAHLKPFVFERNGRIRAYCTSANFWLINHGVAETLEDMQQLLLGAATLLGEPIGLLVPIRHAEFFRWCLSQKLRVLKPMTQMTMGEYQDPRGCFFPSVLY